jgi:hypothetical protein
MEGDNDYQTRFRNGQRYRKSVAIVIRIHYHGSEGSRAAMCRTTSGRGPGEGGDTPRFAPAGAIINRMKDLWYGDARRINAEEMDCLGKPHSEQSSHTPSLILGFSGTGCLDQTRRTPVTLLLGLMLLCAHWTAPPAEAEY